MSIFTAFLLSFFWRDGPQLLSSSENWSISDGEALTEKSVRYPISFSPRDLPEGLLIKMNFSKLVPNLKIAISIEFKLVSKFPSYPVASTYTAGAGFILNILDVEEIAVIAIVEGEVKVTRVLLLAAVIGTVAWLFIGGKVSDIMSLIS